jgi:hypothetical protein
MTTPKPLRSATSLDALLAILSGPAGRELPERGWTRLPTFGGEEPERTTGVWSWDADRLLVGTCSTDLRIVRRPRTNNLIIRLLPSERATLDAAAKRAGMPLGTWLRHLGMTAARGSGVPDRKEER